MAFAFPAYHHPDFDQPSLKNAPDARWETVEKDGVAPEEFHSTSMYPEYFKINGRWTLAEESRMDSCVVLEDDGHLSVVESRNLKKGQRVILGRTEHGQDGIYMHCNGFTQDSETLEDQFVFRQGRSRETSYAKDYDRLVELLRHERDHGNIVWVMGPAFAFDDGARKAMQALIDNGYCHGLLAGNALGTHDLEGALLHTALGQDIYTQQSQPNGHYNHLDVLNKVRRSGSIPQFIEDYHIDNGIIYGEEPCALRADRLHPGRRAAAGGVRQRLRGRSRHAGAGAQVHHGDLPCHHAAHHRHRQHDPLLPGNARRVHPPGVPVRGGRRRVRGE